MSRKFVFVLVLVPMIFLLLALGIFIQIPTAKELKGCLVTQMYKVNLCPGSKSYVSLKNISTYLQKAVLLSEDSTFYQHKGFDWDSIEKSAQENWEKGKIKRGGSTISQQLSKNLFFSKEKTFWRKIFEALYTVQLERVLTKTEIFERYLNVVEFGKEIYGVKAAAQFYFKKSPAELNIAESAFLAILLPNPVKYSKSFFSKELSPFVKSRISRVIGDLHQYQRITDTEYESALNDFANFFGPPLSTEEQLEMEVLPEDYLPIEEGDTGSEEPKDSEE